MKSLEKCRVQTLLSVVLLVSILSGCSGTDFGDLGEIRGTLTLKGEAVPVGTKLIFMQNETGQAGFALTKEGGKYEIEWRREGRTFNGVPVGTYRVMVVPLEAVDIDDFTADEMLEGVVPERAMPNPEMNIPHKYLRTATSGLEYKIDAGENVIDIDIE